MSVIAGERALQLGTVLAVTSGKGGVGKTNVTVNVALSLARLGYRRMFGFVDAANRPARWLYATSGYEDVLRSRTRTVARRLIHVDGRGWLISGKGGLRPLAGIAAAGRRRRGDLWHRTR